MRKALCVVLSAVVLFALAGAAWADVLSPWSVIKDRPTTGRTKVVIREAESEDKSPSGAVSMDIVPEDVASGDAAEKGKR